MAKNTNPKTKKIYGQQSWSTITWNNQGAEIYQDIFIKKLINGIFQKWNYLTSDIQINKYATGKKEISLLYINNQERTKREIQGINTKVGPKGILNLIKAIIKLKFGEEYTIKLIQAPNIFSNAKIVGDYINKKLSQDPRQHRYILNKVTWEYKKAQTIRNKR